MPKDEYHEKKEQYGLWLGLPKEARSPKTMGELAKHLEVSIKSLEKWATDPTVLHNKRNSLKILSSNKDMYDIIQTLTQKAKQGNVSHIKLWLEWQGEVGTIKSIKEKEEPKKFEVKIVS